jgi:hypothetical protein
VFTNLYASGFKSWHYEKSNSLFSRVEMKVVLVVPLLDVVQEDIIWNAEKNGVYSVQSGIESC